MRLGLLAILSVTTLISCDSIQGKPSIINVPASPIYQKVDGGELQCLTDDTYKKLNVRRTQCETRVKTLEGAIKKYNDSIK